MRRLIRSLVAFVALAVTTCGGSAEQPGCVPGQSVACAGVAGCAGFQLCLPDRTFAPCDCSAPRSDGGEPGVDASMPDGVAPTDGSSADANDGGPFSPQSIPGLSVWLDAEKGIVADVTHPARIKRWLDQSGNGNDAVVNSCGNDPVNCMPRIDPKAVGGHDAVQQGFQGDFEIPDAVTLRWGTGNWAIAAVAKTVGTGTTFNMPPFWRKHNGSTGLEIRIVDKTLQLWQGTSFLEVTDQNPTKFQVIVARGPQLDLRVGGVASTGPQATQDIDCVGCTVYLFGWNMLAVAELVAVKGGLTDPQLAALTGYFKAKYSLP